jgi:hypothetical protein
VANCSSVGATLVGRTIAVAWPYAQYFGGYVATIPDQGSVIGGTQVAMNGMLFDTGSSVLFGGVLASSVVLVTANQLTCLTPPHFPALVDVRVTNTNGTSATLLNGFRYVDAAAVVSLPATNGNYGSQVELPLSAANVTGLRAGSIAVTFNPAVLSLIGVRLGTLTVGWSVSYNQVNSGAGVDLSGGRHRRHGQRAVHRLRRYWRAQVLPPATAEGLFGPVPGPWPQPERGVGPLYQNLTCMTL